MSRTPARLQATTFLGFRVITQSPCWPATIKQHFLCSFMCRNSSNWIPCTEEDLSLNAQCKCRRALGCVVGVQSSPKPCCHSRSNHVFPGRVKAFVKNRREEAVIILGFLRTLPLLYTSVTLFQGVVLDWTWHHLPDISLLPSLVKCVGVVF